MILYTLFSLSLFLLLLLNKEIKDRRFFFLSLLLVVVYWGVTYINVPDTPGYQSTYANINPKLDPRFSMPGYFEVGFMYLMWFFKKIGADYYLFQLCLFTTESLLVFEGIKRIGFGYRDLGGFVCLFGFTLPIILMGALRQGLAIALFIYSLHTILEKKYYYYILLIGISYLFHKSSVLLLFIPLWYLFTSMFINRRIVLLVIFIVINVLHFFDFTLSSSFDNLLSILFSGVEDQEISVLDYSIYSGSSVGESNFGVLKLLEVNFCFVFALLLYPQKDNNGIQLLSSLFLIFFILNMLVGGIVIHRITYFLQIPYYLLLFISLMSFFSKLNVNKYGQYVLTFIYVLLTNIILSAPFSSTAIHEYHLFDALGL